MVTPATSTSSATYLENARIGVASRNDFFQRIWDQGWVLAYKVPLIRVLRKVIGGKSDGRNRGVEARRDIVAHHLGGFRFGKSLVRCNLEYAPRQSAWLQFFLAPVFLQKRLQAL